jgi:hypothetical protein
MNLSAVVIGNKASKETHLPDCFCLQRMSEKNKVSFTSLKQALNMGYDTCGHCLPTSVPETQQKSETDKYVGYFCVVHNSVEHCSKNYCYIVGDMPRRPITLRAKLLANDESQTAVAGQTIKISCLEDDVHETVILTTTTDASGIIEAEYNPINLAQGETVFRARFPNGASIEHIDLIIGFMPSISNIRIVPNPFKKKTTILFDLAEDTKIDISIYKNTYFLRSFSHRKTLRSTTDGIMAAGHDLKIEWDGTNERGKQTWRGSYVIRFKTDKDFVFFEGLKKNKGKL